MKANKILFNGDKFDINDNLSHSIQRSLDKSIAGAFIVKEVTVDQANSTVEISIDWNCNDHYVSKPDCLSLSEAYLFCGKLNKDGVQIPIPIHPYGSLFSYNFSSEDLIDEYNVVMKRNNKLQGLSAVSTPNNVTYKYQF